MEEGGGVEEREGVLIGVSPCGNTPPPDRLRRAAPSVTREQTMMDSL